MIPMIVLLLRTKEQEVKPKGDSEEQPYKEAKRTNMCCREVSTNADSHCNIKHQSSVHGTH